MTTDLRRRAEHLWVVRQAYKLHTFSCTRPCPGSDSAGRSWLQVGLKLVRRRSRVYKPPASGYFYCIIGRLVVLLALLLDIHFSQDVEVEAASGS
eukprot:6207104-Pleurochrysis_carterae.AAC.4